LYFRGKKENPNDFTVIKLGSSDNSYSSTFCLNPEAAPSNGQGDRAPYDEENIVSDFTIKNKKIYATKNEAFTDSENIVAMCKKLHLAKLSQEKKWIFSRFVGRVPLNLGRSLELEVVKNIGIKLTCSELYSDGEKVGEIYFS